MDLISMSEYLIKVTFKVSITAAVAFLILAVIDFAYQKWQFGHSLRMSKYEIRKEMKQMEGDPLIKARIREKQRIMGMRRMIQSVPEATVVVTNPTHLAVALKYDEQLMDAPQIVAKGSGYLAEKIKEKAKEFDIPIVEDRPLARSLYKGSEIGDFIPVELYQAVAGIIAAIYALKQK
jgi:flagellar biosynthetic protein FlhB